MKEKTYTNHDIIMKRSANGYRHRWMDGTPIGTGRTGAVIYGDIAAEFMILNRGDLWIGGVNAPVPDVAHCVGEMRELAAQGKYREANNVMYDELVKNGYTYPVADMRALGCVNLVIECSGIYSGYRRVLHTDTAEVEIAYNIEENSYRRRYIASRSRDIIAMDFEADKEYSFSLLSGFFKSYEGGRELDVEKSDAENARYRKDGDCFVYSSLCEGNIFGIVCRVITDGKSQVSDEGISVSDAKKSLLLVKAFSGVESREQGEMQALEEMRNCPTEYSTIFEENLPLYRKLYETADVKLYYGEEMHTNDALLESAQDTQVSAELVEKIWRFGRYLFISGTAADGMPFPLYGLWPCGYEREFTHHVANENVQSIYWHILSGGLSELMVSLIDYYYGKMDAFRENARKLYGCNGIFVGTYTTPKNSVLTVEVPVILHFIGAAGWLSQHFYGYYRYTNDKKLFREKILPFMLEAAQFYEDYYYTDEDGKLVLYPAVSPENSPMEYRDPKKPHAMPVTKNPTIEIAILKELLTNLLNETKERPELAERRTVWEKMLSIMPEYRINADGAIAEWIAPEHSDDYFHRHVSHIYPLFPGYEVEESGTPELFNAFGRAVDLRGIGSFCGWSIPHMAAIYARLGDADSVFKMFIALGKACLLPNLFTCGLDYKDMGISWNPWGGEIRTCVQLDGLMGAVNAVQEMLVFSSPTKLKLLPACPSQLGKGEAILNFATGTVRMSWNIDEEVCSGEITANRDTEFMLELPFGKEAQKISLKAGEVFVF